MKTVEWLEYSPSIGEWRVHIKSCGECNKAKRQVLCSTGQRLYDLCIREFRGWLMR